MRPWRQEIANPLGSENVKTRQAASDLNL